MPRRNHKKGRRPRPQPEVDKNIVIDRPGFVTKSKGKKK